MSTFKYDYLIKDIADFPSPGVIFKDITPLLADPKGFKAAVDAIVEPYRNKGVTKVIGAEARGFMIGSPAAIELGAGFVPARKPGKLPRETIDQEYDLEYGTATLQIHKDAFSSEDKVLIVDDLIATGGTMVAQIKLIEQVGAELMGVAGLLELEFFNPRAVLAEVCDLKMHTLVKVAAQ